MKLFSAEQVKKALGSSIEYIAKKPGFPKAKYETANGYPLWTEEQLIEIKKFFTLKHGDYLTQSDVAKLLDFDQTLIRRGIIDRPTHGDRGIQRWYLPEDLPKLKKQLEDYQPYKSCIRSTEAASHGYYTQVRSAKYLDMPIITFNSYVSRKLLPKPTHKVNGYLCYTTAELESFKQHELKAYFEKRKKK